MSSRFEERDQQLDRVDESAIFDRHDHLYGVEAEAATKAPRQVGPGVRRGVEFVTVRAEEAEESFTLLGGKVQAPADEIVDRDVVSERPEEIARKSLAHGEFPQNGLFSPEGSRFRHFRSRRMLSTYSLSMASKASIW